MALTYPLISSILMCGGPGTGGCCSDSDGGCTRESRDFARVVLTGEYRLGLRRELPGEGIQLGDLDPGAGGGYGSMQQTLHDGVSTATGAIASPHALRPRRFEDDTSDEDESESKVRSPSDGASKAEGVPGSAAGSTLQSRFGSLTFLTSDYSDDFFWWECVELAKTTMFNAVFRQKSWGELGQFSLATALAFIFLLLYVGLRPFRGRASNIEAIAMNAVLCILCFAGLLLQLCQASLLAGVTTADHAKIEMMQDVLKFIMLATLLLWAALFAWQIIVLALGHTVVNGVSACGGYLCKACFPCMYTRTPG